VIILAPPEPQSSFAQEYSVVKRRVAGRSRSCGRPPESSGRPDGVTDPRDLAFQMLAFVELGVLQLAERRMNSSNSTTEYTSMTDPG